MNLRKISGFLWVALFIPLLSQQVISQDSFYLEEIFTIEQSDANKVDTAFIKTWVSGDKFRREQGEPAEIMIGRLDKEVIWQVNPVDSSYTEIDLETMRSLALFGLYMMGLQIDEDGNIIVPDDLYEKTGKSKKIGEWDAEEVSLNSKYAKEGLMSNVSLWISQDIRLPADLYAGLMRRLLGNPTGEVEKLFELWTKLDGYPVLVETSTMGITNRNLLYKIEQREIPDSLFELPAGFIEEESAFPSILDRK